MGQVKRARDLILFVVFWAAVVFILFYFFSDTANTGDRNPYAGCELFKYYERGINSKSPFGEVVRGDYEEVHEFICPDGTVKARIIPRRMQMRK